MSFKFHKEAIRELAALLKETGLGEIEYRDGNVSIKLKQNQERITVAHHSPTVQSEISPLSNQCNAQMQEQKITSSNNFKEVKSPMVGTVYLAPKPDAPPFVQKGSKVSTGDILFIVEAMKVMNEVKSPFSGVIEEILVSDSDSVEFDQVLAKVS